MFVATLGVLLLASSCAQPAEAPSPQEEGVLRVEVSRNGFNNTTGGFRLEVEEGQEVKITFVYKDGDLGQNNPHIIAIPDYGIDTGVLDQTNPEVTLNFTASKAGESTFGCTRIECIGHTNLAKGIIIVEEEGHGHAEEERHG